MEKEEALGQELYEAFRGKKTVPPFTTRFGNMTEEAAYRVQRQVLRLMEKEGYHRSGRKMGYTNPSMQKAMKLQGPSWGNLFRELRYADGAEIPHSQFIQPGIEAEILFVLGEDIPHGPVTREALLQDVDGICLSLEIVDMRQNRTGKTQRDSIGDNGSFGAYVIGSALQSTDVNGLAGLTARVYRNGELAAEGQGTNVMGDPVDSLLWLANQLADTDDFLRAGEEVLSGSFTPLLTAEAGDSFRAEFEGLGSVSVCLMNL